ncbi:hypothetical protein ACFL27_12935 [candidate division CSSED10-310 bacterium]|uniref:Uncharacterized protein n=1 Tax=candidate division CSSED10-310 bacterium TaxID=2855610 RepID=A0ABV6YY14_UNCC1
MDVLRSLLTPEVQKLIEREREGRAILDEADKLTSSGNMMDGLKKISERIS